MKKYLQICSLGLLLILLGLACQSSYPPITAMTYDAVLINRQEQQVLFLHQDVLLSARGDTLARYDGDQLLNHLDQPIGSIQGTDIVNLQGQPIGRVVGEALLNLQGRRILRVEGSDVSARVKVAAGYFYFLE